MSTRYNTDLITFPTRSKRTYFCDKSNLQMSMLELQLCLLEPGVAQELSSSRLFGGVAHSFIFCYFVDILFSVLRFTAADYSFSCSILGCYWQFNMMLSVFLTSQVLSVLYVLLSDLLLEFNSYFFYFCHFRRI